MAVAGRSEFSDNEQTARMAYEELFRLHNFKIDAFNPSETVLFPELEENAEVPEITESCWNILNKSPNDLMCSNSHNTPTHSQRRLFGSGHLLRV